MREIMDQNKNKIDSREVALKVLDEVLNEGAYSNLSLKEHLKNSLDSRDTALTREIVYGVLENNLYLEHIISAVSTVQIEKMDANILLILKIAIYQIKFLDKIPNNASVNEAVELTKKIVSPGLSGFVNGVLRNYIRNSDKFDRIREKDKLKALSIKYSYPMWIIKMWKKEMGEDEMLNLLQKMNETPPIIIRCNTLKCKSKDLEERIKARGIEIKKCNLSKESFKVKADIPITELKEFKEGIFSIQDESSSLASLTLNPKKNTLVLDVCSAPGGKACHMAEIMENKGSILACDIHPHRLQIINLNAKREGIDIIKTVKMDATVFYDKLENKADYILLDAPCSGLGIIRRKPEIKYQKTEKDVKDLAKIQYEMLNVVKKYLKPGGVLVYSTCTISRRENEDNIERFLKENSDFQLEGFDISESGIIQLLPSKDDTDGFFISKLLKKVK